VSPVCRDLIRTERSITIRVIERWERQHYSAVVSVNDIDGGDFNNNHNDNRGQSTGPACRMSGRSGVGGLERSPALDPRDTDGSPVSPVPGGSLTSATDTENEVFHESIRFEPASRYRRQSSLSALKVFFNIYS